jgi:hypothetical protein
MKHRNSKQQFLVCNKKKRINILYIRFKNITLHTLNLKKNILVRIILLLWQREIKKLQKKMVLNQ